MRTFEAMWKSIGERVTDLIFRMEQLDRGFRRLDLEGNRGDARRSRSRPPRWPSSNSRRSTAPKADEKIEPIRNRGRKVGRNDPCPCGSGKKYKNCHMPTRRHGVK